MKLLPDPSQTPAVIRSTVTGLVALLSLVGSCVSYGEGLGPATAEDAINMIEADEQAFFEIIGSDEQGAPGTDELPPGSEKPSADVSDDSVSVEADPALEDFAAYALLIDTDLEAPDNLELLIARAELFLERGFHEKAIEDSLMVLRLDIDNQAAWHTLGRAHEMTGELEMAGAAYDEAIDLGPETELGVAARWDQESLTLVGEDDRRETLEKLGTPDAFTLVMVASATDSQDINRHETWYYYRAGARFEFVNGIYVEDAAIEDVDFTTVEAILSPYRPYQFSPNLNLEDVADIVGEQDYVLCELGEKPLQDSELVYTRQLALGFKNGGLFYVRTFPLFTDQ